MLLETNPQAVNRLLLSLPEAAKVLGIGYTTLLSLRRAKQIREVQIGGRTLVPRSELERFVAAQLDEKGV